MNDALFAWANSDFLSLERIELLRHTFGDLKTAWEEGTEKSFIEAGITPKASAGFFKRKKDYDAEKARAAFEKSGAKLLFIEDEDYPERLRNIPAPPIFLFYKGDLVARDSQAIAVVGSRTYSAQGKEAVSKIVPDLSRAGLTIISGLARGIDALAHKEALNNEGRTIAVLGSGIDRIWPEENRHLAEKIINGFGAVLSEFPLGTEPFAYNFPRRNRIISGLSLGVLVIEGKEKSGSLITAHTALEQGREVFAVPGNAFAILGAGTNSLIKKGEAKLITSAADILEEFAVKKPAKTLREAPHDPTERKIWDLLGGETKLFDEIIRESDLNPAVVSATLTMLEMKGYVQNIGMGQWVRV